MNKHYCEYFSVKKDYQPCMDKEGIEKSNDTWLDYYPHKTFIEILRELLKQIDSGYQSLWITGAYGTGKSHCALVLQKLFNDNENRVEKYFADNEKLFGSNEIKNSLFAKRKESVLVVFDSGSAGVNATDGFLVRIEKAIKSQLEESEYKIPPFGGIDKIKEKIKFLGNNFFETRDSMLSELSELNQSIKTYDDLILKIEKADKNTSVLISDIQKVLHRNDIWLDLNIESLKKWINDIIELNGINKIILIWDEFSDFMDNNKAQLTTMQEVAEMAQNGKFFFVPTTHLKLTSFVAEGMENAKKIRDRFVNKQIDMPNGIALKCASKALNANSETLSEWEKEREVLWNDLRWDVENKIKTAFPDVEVNDFKELLPIHPMTAIVLKYLAEFVGSNQRSLFDFMAKSQEFQDFIKNGGVAEWNKSILTIDYLWEYFVENDKLGNSNKLHTVKSEFMRNKIRLTQEEDRRVLKAILLFRLLSDDWKNKDEGNKLLFATIDNIKLSFKGDGALYSRVETIIEKLKTEHCFQVIDGRIEPFGSSIDVDAIKKKKQNLSDKFSSLVLEEKTRSRISEKIRVYNYGNRYDVRCFGVKETNVSNIKYKETFGEDGNKILVQFVLVKDKDEQLKIVDKISEVSKQLKDFRTIFISLDTTFCSKDACLWDSYIEQSASYELASDQMAKKIHKTQLLNMEKDWESEVLDDTRKLMAFWYEDGEDVKTSDINWGQLKDFIILRTKKWFNCYTDDFSEYNQSAFSVPRALKSWAEAGILFDKYDGKDAGKTLIDIYKKKGIRGDISWFKENPQHNLTKMRDYCEKRLDNTVGQGNPCSIRKIYIDLQRSPYGLLNVSNSALVLGFVLKEFLDKNLQWTDEINSGPLDVKTLSEIIESVVKNDSNGDIKKEKLICRISKEEKAFIDACPKMFGMKISNDATVESVLRDLTPNIERLCDGSPLWILSEYIHKEDIEDSAIISELIDNLCLANSMSSANKTGERVNCVTKIGKLILENTDIADKVAKVLTNEKISNAFYYFVDTKKPELKSKANKEQDYTEYYKSVKSKLAETASWLWKSQDIVPILDEIICQYDIMAVVKELKAAHGFMPFDEAIRQMKIAIFEENKISLDVWVSSYPSFKRIFDLLKNKLNGQVVSELADLIKKHKSDLRDVFFNITKEKQIIVAKKILQDVWNEFSLKEDKEIYNKFGNWATLSENEFKDNALRFINEYKSNLESEQNRELWKKEQSQIKEKIERISETKAKDILLKLLEKYPAEFLLLDD